MHLGLLGPQFKNQTSKNIIIIQQDFCMNKKSYNFKIWFAISCRNFVNVTARST